MAYPQWSRRAPASILALCLISIPSAGLAQWVAGGTALYEGPRDQVVECAIPGGVGAIVCWTDAVVGSTHTDVWAKTIDRYGGGRGYWDLNPEGAAVCAAPGAQFDVGAVPDGRGGILACWTDERDGSGDIYAQRLRGDGSIYPSWIWNGVAICTAPRTQRLPAIASDGAGGAFIAWSDARDSTTSGVDIFLQHILESGAIADGWPANGIPVGSRQGQQDLHAIVADGEGGVILVWRDAPAQGGVALRALRVTGSGAVAPGWPAEGAALAAAPAAPAGGLRLIADGAGGAIAAWEDVRSGADARDVYAQRIDSSGAIPSGWPAEGLPVATGSGDEQRPALCGDRERGAYVAWWEAGGIHLQRVDSLGVTGAGWPPGGVPVAVSFVPVQSPTILADGEGGALLFWADARNGMDRDVYAVRVVSSGAVAPNWAAGGIALCTVGGDQDLAGSRPGVAPEAVVPDGAGGALLPWTDRRTGVDADVYVQGVTKDAVIAPSRPSRPSLPSCWEYACERNDIERLVPNPTRGRFAVDVTVWAAGEATLEVFDLQGRPLLRRGYTLRSGVRSESLDLDLSHLAAGVYFLAYRLRGLSEIYGHAKVIIAR